MENVNKRNETPVMKCFTECSLGCGLFHILLVMMTSAEYLSTSWVQSFQLFPSEWELCSYWVILISLQSLQRPDCTLDVLYVDRSPAPDPVDSKLSLPSRVGKSDGLVQGTLPGTFEYWHVFWSLASPLLKKNMKKWITISPDIHIRIFTRGILDLPKLWQSGPVSCQTRRQL